jgi:hypothetical protein
MSSAFDDAGFRDVFGRARPTLFVALVLLALLILGSAAWAADLSLPATVQAGSTLSIGTSGSGDAEFYLIGPASRVKQKIRLGNQVTIAAADLHQAGRYLAILRTGDSSVVRTFWVQAAAADTINFLAQPSRVPAGVHDVISGTAFVMDHSHNLVLAPTPVRFELVVEDSAPELRNTVSRDGVAWARMDSTRRAGNAQFTASIGDTRVTRVVQQTAADPCNLRMHAGPAKQAILVETDPVRDCSGNPVPDGTIVTFTSVDPSGRTTVDAVVKRGVARAELPPAPRATISVASGVVMGNEIRWGGGQ